MAYPSSLDELTDGVPSDGAAPTTALGDATYPLDDWARAVSTAVEAVEAELGTDPSGAAATVAARFTATETVANAALPAATAASTYQPLDADLTAVAALTAPATTITNAVLKTTVDAKGDLLVGTADDTVARLAVGANGTRVSADSAESSGLIWTHPRIAPFRTSAVSYIGGAVTGGVETSLSMSTTYPAYLPIFSPCAVAVDRVDIYVNTQSSSGVARLALYTASPSTRLPLALSAALGSPTTASTGWKSTTISATLPAGLSWVRLDPSQNFTPGAYQPYQCPAFEWVSGAFSPTLYLEEVRAYDGTDPTPSGSYTKKTAAVPVVRFRVA